MIEEVEGEGLPTSEPVAVVGAGTMGAGIAQVAAMAGHPVKLFDGSEQAVTKGFAAIRQSLDKLVSRGHCTCEHAEACLARIETVSEIATLKTSALVVEAIFEDLAAKHALLRSLEEQVAETCLIATNTSSLSISRLASVLKHPQRFAGMHFFNPVPRMELVEVVEGLATSSATVRTIYATAQQWGKKPVMAKSTPGFIVNRVARPFYGEALRILAESTIGPQIVDAVMRDCGGFRMGPFELMDLIGNDINFAVTKAIWEAYSFDPRYAPSPIQQELVYAGRLGRKTGHGYYLYGENTAAMVVPTESDRQAPAKIQLQTALPFGRALAARLPKDIAIAHRDTDAATPLLSIGDTEVFCTDGMLAAERSATRGVKNLVLLDLCLNYETAQRIALSRSPTCSPKAFDEVAGLLQSAGFAVTAIDDVPGMIVMRTVAMLANEALEAVGQQVCTEAGVDLAMQLGTNYPIGPIAWMQRVGVAAVVEVLKNLGKYNGGGRYRVAPRMHSLYWSNSLEQSGLITASQIDNALE